MSLRSDFIGTISAYQGLKQDTLAFFAIAFFSLFAVEKTYAENLSTWTSNSISHLESIWNTGANEIYLSTFVYLPYAICILAREDKSIYPAPSGDWLWKRLDERERELRRHLWDDLQRLPWNLPIYGGIWLDPDLQYWGES